MSSFSRASHLFLPHFSFRGKWVGSGSLLRRGNVRKEPPVCVSPKHTLFGWVSGFVPSKTPRCFFLGGSHFEEGWGQAGGQSPGSLIAGVPDQPLTSSCCGSTSPLFSDALWWVGAVETGAHGRWEELCPGGWECKRPAVGAGPSGPTPFCQPSLSSVLGWAWTARGRPALLVPGSGLSPDGHYANDFSMGLRTRGAQGHQDGREPGVSLTPLRGASEGVGVG